MADHEALVRETLNAIDAANDEAFRIMCSGPAEYIPDSQSIQLLDRGLQAEDRVLEDPLHLPKLLRPRRGQILKFVRSCRNACR